MGIPGSKLTPDQRRRLRKEKYAPLGNRYKTQLDLERAANQRTAGVIRPKLGALTEEGVAERQAHKGRVQDLGQTYAYQDNAVRDAYAKTQEALDRVLTTSATADTTSQANLAAALAQSREANLDQANAVGGTLGEGNAAANEQAVASLGSSSLASLGQSVAAGLTSAAGGIGRVALGRTRALEDESQRFGAKIGEIQKAKTGVKKEWGSVKEEQREALENAELAKATERAREKIAKGSLNLEKRKTTEEEHQHDAENAIAWGAIKAEKEKFRAEIEAASGEGGKAEAEAIAAKYDAGVATFQSYLDNHKPNQVVPADLFRAITLSTNPKMALDIMSHTTNQQILAFVAKKRGGGKKKETSGPPNPKTGKRGPNDWN